MQVLRLTPADGEVLTAVAARFDWKAKLKCHVVKNHYSGIPGG